MNILIISDSHGRWGRISDAIDRQTEKPSALFFLGDGLSDLWQAELSGIPVYSVAGNCDRLCEQDSPTTLTVTLGGVTFFITHGHTLGVKSTLDRAILAASQADADVLLYGHTHFPDSRTIPAGESVLFSKLAKPLHVFNPGSLGYDGVFGTAELRDGKILFSHGSL